MEVLAKSCLQSVWCHKCGAKIAIHVQQHKVNCMVSTVLSCCLVVVQTAREVLSVSQELGVWFWCVAAHCTSGAACMCVYRVPSTATCRPGFE